MAETAEACPLSRGLAAAGSGRVALELMAAVRPASGGLASAWLQRLRGELAAPSSRWCMWRHFLSCNGVSWAADAR